MAIRKKPLTVEAAQLRMADLCSRSEQCEYEIKQKLYRLGINSADRDAIVSYLVKNRFINNARYARSYARDKCRFSGWGPYKIREGLALKRVASKDITEGIEAVEEKDWEEALMRTASSKARNMTLRGEGTGENRRKLYRYLISRGFRSDDVVKCIKKIMARREEEE